MFAVEQDGMRRGLAGGEGSGGGAWPIGDEHRQIGQARVRLDTTGGVSSAKSTRGGDTAIDQGKARSKVARHQLRILRHVYGSSSSCYRVQ